MSHSSTRTCRIPFLLPPPNFSLVLQAFLASLTCTEQNILHGQEMELEDCANMWWLRFALDRQCRTLACGTTSGTVLVWDPHTLCRRPKAKLKRGPGSKIQVPTLLMFLQQ